MLLNVVYAAAVENMDSDQKDSFDEALGMTDARRAAEAAAARRLWAFGTGEVETAP